MTYCVPRTHTPSKRFHQANPSVDMSRVAAIILGGGQGTRLFPLTQSRCKPAISFGGRYRLIDVPISNSVNSGCHKIFIITQFLSSSLHQHIFNTYRHDIFSSGFLELLPAEEKPSQKEWFQGTADAVRQNLDYFVEAPVDYFLILSGDQLYHMDYQEMIRAAKESDADLLVASLPINSQEAKRMGVLRINENQTIVEFVEKPQDEAVLQKLRQPVEGMTTPEKPFLGSMGIYVFKREALIEFLEKTQHADFGKHLIPAAVSQGRAATYIYQGYWEDIGTVGSFYDANMALTVTEPLFDCYDEHWPLYSNRYNLPGPKIFNSCIKNSIICEGCIVEADQVTHSILGPRTVVKSGSIIRDTYIMGNDFYIPPIHTSRLPQQLHIGEDCLIQKAILDKHVHLGKGVQLINKNRLPHYDGEQIFIRDGIIVVPRGVSLPDGFIL
jgi:glucose-1-phosphate adenylyltransferase